MLINEKESNLIVIIYKAGIINRIQSVVVLFLLE